MADEPTWDEIFSSQPNNPSQSGTPSQPDGTGQPTQPPASGRADPFGTAEPIATSRRQLREQESGRRWSDDSAQVAKEESRRDRRSRSDDSGLPPRKKRRRLTWLWVLLVIVALLGGGVTAVWLTFETQIRHVLGWEESNDYTGTGTGKVVITIKNGQTGEDVAKTLVSAKVVKSFDAFYGLLLKQSPAVNFQPGSFALKGQMSSKSALAALVDPKNKVFTQIVLPEGITVRGVIDRLAKLSSSTGVTGDQLTAAAADYKSFGLPDQAPSLEGYLFPATYSLDPGLSAHDMLNVFVKEMFKRLDAAGVAPDDRHRVLTLAALTQKEGGNSADFLKVARVWDNRIDNGMNLQSDATVSYGAGGTTISTTDAQRADKSNPYNTYANPGLPVGPISNPGMDAINATLHPADGPWIYFVLVNGETGETVFSTTLAEHNAAVKQWQAWLKAHPGFDAG
ncbi:MAG: hypothetical protein JWO10_207 [Microbacteriaceae bacterium]|nr:hypothetical protein [Microbacteriaceae bacterium]